LSERVAQAAPMDLHTGSYRASCAWREVEGVVLAVTGAASLLTRTESWRPPDPSWPRHPEDLHVEVKGLAG
jgi:hypothetical protein